MRIWTLVVAKAILVSLFLVFLVQPNASFAQSPKKSTKKSVTPAKPAARKAKPAKKRPLRRTVRRRVVTPANQRVPTKARYAEIQQALADAGYFSGEASGVWQQESIEAMKAFQDSQGLDPTGKIDARSLIKLGMGPAYGSSATNESKDGDVREPG